MFFHLQRKVWETYSVLVIVMTCWIYTKNLVFDLQETSFDDHFNIAARRSKSERKWSSYSVPASSAECTHFISLPHAHKLIPKSIGNRKEIVREVALGVINLTWENLQIASTNQSAELNERLPDLCFAICRFSHVRFITPSHLTHNFFFYFQYFLVLIWFIFSMGRTIGLGWIWSLFLGFRSLVAQLAPCSRNKEGEFFGTGKS